MHSSQSNTIQGGSRKYNSSEALTDKEGYLVNVVDGGSIPELALPTAVTDVSLFVVTDGNALDEESDVIPVVPGAEIRIKAKSTGSAGAILVHADPSTAADKGKVRAIPATAGLYFSPGVAAEDFVDGQLVKVNPLPRIVNVESADSLTALTFTAGGATGPEVEALRDALLALLQAQGIVASA
ncbi:MAG: hypothetical protein ACREIA_10250 [Opitutaceae bacterium]